MLEIKYYILDILQTKKCGVAALRWMIS